MYEYHHNTTGRLIFIGDVHGHLRSFNKLLEKLSLVPEDRVVLLGDMVSKGPNSIGLLARAKEINALCVRGNHDDLVVSWRDFFKWNRNSWVIGEEHQNIASALPQELYGYLASCPLILHIPAYSMYAVHAGLDPYTPVHLQNPFYVMNIRRILPNSRPSKGKDEGIPWATVWNRMQSKLRNPKTVIYGHESSRGLVTLPYAIGLDTGCGRGERLSAMIYPQRRLISVKC
ncbi:Ser/Thr protein phosphatase family protein [Basidiobolus meristosporus CBS 931.73]|uniref:Ser/Thr protein phosphatase family protein n=1 Tax=Basidiobolus meristosporus CBS 931.73 TaxID=1314790 RepID=A0A1Y1XXZ3_9FUNG|nr:Ser/Thr protein phosphatase family protein [Basidiobolus meristosporus CBS 931.73]|eukprot:ORX90613.1 Ser/Thr protein phosphatase family protein [Basidiobolus meristosporus CBS 931.73]